MNNEKPLSLSIIIPAYNEAEIIKNVLEKLKNELSGLSSLVYEIIVVNDCSTDDTKKIVAEINGIKLINHPFNKGYGASIKTGAKNARYDWLLFFDADDQHKPEYITKLVGQASDADMIVGAREGYKGPWIRQPGKKVLIWLANYLVNFKIPDLNSGLRLVKKDLFFRYIHLYPNNFSLSTTITLSFIKEGLTVKYVPITINKRVGKSTVKPRHAFDTLALITRMIVLFSPMKFFLPFNLVFLLLFLFFIGYDIVHADLSNTSVILFISTILIFFFSVMLDQIAAIRREINK